MSVLSGRDPSWNANWTSLKLRGPISVGESHWSVWERPQLAHRHQVHPGAHSRLPQGCLAEALKDWMSWGGRTVSPKSADKQFGSAGKLRTAPLKFHFLPYLSRNSQLASLLGFTNCGFMWINWWRSASSVHLSPTRAVNSYRTSVPSPKVASESLQSAGELAPGAPWIS